MRACIVSLPDPCTTIRRVRGTVLASSFQLMRRDGLESAYWSRLPEEHHPVMRAMIPMSWLDVPPVLAHYRVLDALVVDPAHQRRNGAFVAKRIHQTYLQTLVRALRNSGAIDPGVLLRRMPSVWARVFEGGGVQIEQVGPKDVEIEAVGIPLFDFSYFRLGWEGVFEGILGLVVRKVYVNSVESDPTKHSLKIRIAWV